MHHNTPILWNSSLLLVQSRPKAFKAIIDLCISTATLILVNNVQCVIIVCIYECDYDYVWQYK